MNRRHLVAAVVSCAVLWIAGPASSVWAQAAPDSIGGLVAWYRADDLTLRENGEIDRWPDASGNGHDLTVDVGGPPAILKTNRLADKPVVLAREDSAYDVTDPIDLQAHTLILVASTRTNTRALFRGKSDRKSQGVVLQAQGGEDAIWYGGDRDDQRHAYGVEGWGSKYRIVSLIGDGAQLQSFVDGLPVGGGAPFEEMLQFGKLLQLRVTTARRIDAADLKLAELAVYDRALDDAERGAVEAHLAARWQLALGGEAPPLPAAAGTVAAPGMARLATTVATDVNGAAIAVPWDTAEVVEQPFDVDPAQPTRLVATAGVRVRLYASLPLKSEADGALVRLLFRLNGAQFLRGEGRSAVLSATGPGSLGVVRAETVVELQQGDHVEVIAIAAGVAGTVKLEPGGAVFIAEER